MFVIFIFIFISEILGERFPSIIRGGRVKEWDEIFLWMPFYLLSSFIFAFLIMKVLIIIKGKTLICIKCGNMKNASLGIKCTCGGEFKDLDEVKWIDGNDRREGREGDSSHFWRDRH